MKIAISASGPDFNSQIDPRFGRCAYFIIAETDDMSYEALNNASMSLGGGAGIAATQSVASKGVKAVITGNCGPNAVNTLTAAGVQLYVGQSGSVKEAVERFRANQLNATSEPNVVDHFGMGGGALVEERTIDLVETDLAHEPLVADFVIEQQSETVV